MEEVIFSNTSLLESTTMSAFPATEQDRVFWVTVIYVIVMAGVIFCKDYFTTPKQKTRLKRTPSSSVNSPPTSPQFHAINKFETQMKISGFVNEKTSIDHRARRRSFKRSQKEATYNFVPNDNHSFQDFHNFYSIEPFEQLPVETEVGNCEYKLKLAPPTADRFEQLVSQLQYRLAEGLGEAIYEIGVSDDGTPIGISEHQLNLSLHTLTSMAKKLGATVQILRARNGISNLVESSASGEKQETFVAEVLVRKLAKEKRFREVRVALCGCDGAGKSTLLEVLAHGELDDGCGQARVNVLRHKHEIESGRTSDIAREILGFDQTGTIVNYSDIRTPTWIEICENATTVVMLMDLAGDERYLRTTVSELLGNRPDYALLLVDGSNAQELKKMTLEHYQLITAIGIPCVVVVTKMDVSSLEIQQRTIEKLKVLLSQHHKEPFVVQSEADIPQDILTTIHQRTPILPISSVTGLNLELMQKFLSLLRFQPEPQRSDEEQSASPLFYIGDCFSVSNVGVVVSGTLVAGEIALNDTLYYGPNRHGEYGSVIVKSIQANRLPVKKAIAGQSFTIALSGVEREQIVKGQVLTTKEKTLSVWQFTCSVNSSLDNASLSGPENGEIVIHCGFSRQTGTVVSRSSHDQHISITVRYKYQPQFVCVDDKIVITDGGAIKGVGAVTHIL